VKVFAIDPGATHSALVVLEDTTVHLAIDMENTQLLREYLIGRTFEPTHVCVIEQVDNVSVAGRELFRTVFWSGRFYQAWVQGGNSVVELPRRDVKLALCDSLRVNDGNIRTVLLDKWGGPKAAVGSKKIPGPLYGLKGHHWQALALAVTFQQLQQLPPVPK
jgi:hypothetical protein